MLSRVGLERTMLGEQPDIGRLHDIGRRLFQRQPSQLIAAGQVLDRQDPTVASLDRLAPLLDVGGADGPRLSPFQAAPM